MKKAFAALVAFLIIGGAVLLVIKPNKYDFVATNEQNASVSMRDFEGRYKVVYFGFLYCPDVCPTTMALLAEALKRLKRDDFEILYFTLDPERDTAENLTMFAKNFYPHATGLVLKDLPKTATAYGVKYRKMPMPNSAMGYSVAHSTALFLFDKQGKFYGEISNLTPENIEQNLRDLVHERP